MGNEEITSKGQEETIAPVEPTWLGMWTPRAVGITIAVLGTGAVVWWIFTSITDFLMMILMSFFLAFAMAPAVERLARRGWKRGVATAVVLVGTAIIGLVLFVAFFGLIIGQTVELIDKVPEWVDSITIWLNDSFSIQIDPSTFELDAETVGDLVKDYGDDVAGVILGIGAGLVGLFMWAITASLFIFYILADAPKLRRAITAPFRPARARVVQEVYDVSIEKVGGYVYSRAILAAISGTVHTIAFTIIDLPSAFALGVFVGLVSQFIPNIGTYIAGFVPTLVALLDDPIKAVYVLAVILIYQQIENLFLQPRVTAGTMELHPALAFGSVIVGINLLGAAGALLALPVTATIQAFLVTYMHRDEEIDPELIAAAEAEAEHHEKKRSRWRRRSRDQETTTESAD